MTPIVFWVAVILAGGPPQVGVFPDRATCMQAVAAVEAQLAADGANDGDAVSGCVEVTLREPATAS